MSETGNQDTKDETQKEQIIFFNSKVLRMSPAAGFQEA